MTTYIPDFTTEHSVLVLSVTSNIFTRSSTLLSKHPVYDQMNSVVKNHRLGYVTCVSRGSSMSTSKDKPDNQSYQPTTTWLPAATK